MPSSISGKFYIGSDIIFAPQKNSLIIKGESCHLEPLQSKILLLLINNQGKVLSTQKMADQVWQRSHVSDSLVRQVISQLRAKLRDQNRPYTIIKTIPKQGYLFDIEVTEKESETLSIEEQQTIKSHHLEPSHKAINLRPTKTIILLVIVSILGCLYWWSDDVYVRETYRDDIIPVVFHDIILDKEKDYSIAKNTYNYIFYGLNSSKYISGYHFTQLNSDTNKKLKTNSIELKGWIKEIDSGYKINILMINNKNPKLNIKIEKSFNKSNFFNNIGDLVLELKMNIIPTTPKYNVSNHRLTSVNDYNDWNAISEGIPLFYQGKGGQELDNMSLKLEEIVKQRRDNYLVYSLLSYVSSMHFLQSGKDVEKDRALSLAYKAFEKNPRCDMVNISLGLALILNDHSEQAFPYLSYAAETAPSPLSFYLLSIVERKSNNTRGADYHYQSFIELNRQKSGPLFELMASSQKSDTL